MKGDGAKRDIFVPHQLSEMDKAWKHRLNTGRSVLI